MITDANKVLASRLAKPSEARFVDPLMEVIELSSEADLANMARSLVEIQAIRQSINVSTSTAGGPIDVAIVSKIRGFCWEQHKWSS